MVLAVCLWRPGLAGPPAENATTWARRITGLRHLLPPAGLFLVVVGSIYAGIATPTEAAALGLMATLALMAANGQLSVPVNYNSGEVPMNEAADLVGPVGSVEELHRIADAFREPFARFFEHRSRWHEAARYISPMPVNFGLVAHLANLRWWNGLDAGARALLEREMRTLENTIFQQATTETATGIACNTGTAPCPEGQPATMTLVALTPADEALRKRAFSGAILPAFAQRCGAECVQMWNEMIGPLVGATAR